MGVEGLPVDPTDLIEGLAIKQTPQLYELDPPKYTSSYGKDFWTNGCRKQAAMRAKRNPLTHMGHAAM